MIEKSLINVEKSGIVWIAGEKSHEYKFPAMIKLVKFPFYTEQVRVYALPVLLFLGKRTPREGMGFGREKQAEI